MPTQFELRSKYCHTPSGTAQTKILRCISHRPAGGRHVDLRHTPPSQSDAPDKLPSYINSKYPFSETQRRSNLQLTFVVSMVSARFQPPDAGWLPSNSTVSVIGSSASARPSSKQLSKAFTSRHFPSCCDSSLGYAALIIRCFPFSASVEKCQSARADRASNGQTVPVTTSVAGRNCHFARRAGVGGGGDPAAVSVRKVAPSVVIRPQ